MNAIETREPAQIGHATINVDSSPTGNRTRDPSRTKRRLYPLSHGHYTCSYQFFVYSLIANEDAIYILKRVCVLPCVYTSFHYHATMKRECAVSMLKSIVSVSLLPRAAHRGFHKVSMTELGGEIGRYHSLLHIDNSSTLQHYSCPTAYF